MIGQRSPGPGNGGARLNLLEGWRSSSLLHRAALRRGTVVGARVCCALTRASDRGGKSVVGAVGCRRDLAARPTGSRVGGVGAWPASRAAGAIHTVHTTY